MSQGGSEEAPIDTKLNIQALQQQFQRMNAQLEEIRERLDHNDQQVNQIQQGTMPRGRRQNRRPSIPPADHVDTYEGENEEFDDETSLASIRRQRDHRPRRHRQHMHQNRDVVDRNTGSIKLSLPPFQGKNDPDAYIEWERKVELVFDCHNYSEEKKVKLAAVSFTDYAIVWWDQLVLSRKRNREIPIDKWDDMKAAMRRRFVPSHYYRDLHLKLQSLKQGTKSIEEYHKEMEITMIRANVEEDIEATKARFICGLNREIANVVELRHYVEIEDVVHMAMKVERQLKRGGRSSSKHEAAGSSNWKSKWSSIQNKKKSLLLGLKKRKLWPNNLKKVLIPTKLKEIVILNASDVKALVIFLLNAQTREP